MRSKVMMVIVSVAILIGVMKSSSLNAQVAPNWLPQHDLFEAEVIYDFLEIPGTNMIFAATHCQGHYHDDFYAVFKSSDGGHTWDRVFTDWNCHWSPTRKLAYDTTRNTVFAGGYFCNNYSLAYSMDYGETWYKIAHPFVGLISGVHFYDILLVNDYIYVAPSDLLIYSAQLWRLDIHDSNPDNWTWEFVLSYPELDYLVRLGYKDGKLYVFGKDKDADAIRIFIHDISKLDSMAKPYKTVAQLREINNSIVSHDANNTSPSDTVDISTEASK